MTSDDDFDVGDVDDDIDDEDYVPEMDNDARRNTRSRRMSTIKKSYQLTEDVNFPHSDLIEVVKEYDFLYDNRSQWFTDNARRERAWKEIASIVNATEQQCKDAWSNLRDGYIRSLKRRQHANGASHKPWKYDAEMEFLAAFLNIQTNGNATPTEPAAFASTNDSEADLNLDAKEDDPLPAEPTPEVETEGPFVSGETPTQSPKRLKIEPTSVTKTKDVKPIVTPCFVPLSKCDLEVNNLRANQEKQTTKQTTPTKRRIGRPRKKTVTETPSRENALKPVETVVVQATPAPPAVSPSPVTTATPSSTSASMFVQDDIDMFFSCIAATVKQFSPMNKAMAKSRVFSVISEMEMMEIAKNGGK